MVLTYGIPPHTAVLLVCRELHGREVLWELHFALVKNMLKMNFNKNDVTTMHAELAGVSEHDNKKVFVCVSFQMSVQVTA